MSAKIDTLETADGDSVYPVTKTSAVYDNNNNRLDNTLATVPILSDTISTTAATPRDADTLSGHAASYFATNDSLNALTNKSIITKSGSYASTGTDGYVDICSITLPIGIYVVTGYVRGNKNIDVVYNNYIRNVTTNTGLQTCRTSMNSGGGVSNTLILNITTPSVIALSTYDGSPFSSATFTGVISAIKIN